MSVHRFDPCDPAGQTVPPSAKVTCHHRLSRRPAVGLASPGGAVKVLTPRSLGALVLGEGLVTEIATCSLLVWDDCPDCPQGPPGPPQPPQSHTERDGEAKQTQHCGPQQTSTPPQLLSREVNMSVRPPTENHLHNVYKK